MNIEHFFIHPVFVALFGWLAFNLIMFRIEKDKSDSINECFNTWQYICKTWDNWLASLVCVPVILFIGYKQLDIGMVDAEKVHWNDLYYLFAGFVPELVIVIWEKWKKKQ